MKMAKEEQTRGLQNLEVSITGKLASMNREQAVSSLEAAGASYVAHPGEHTDLLVVGQGGPPLGADGHLTKSLLQARVLQLQGSELRVIGEDEFLELLGDDDRRADLHRLYTTQQLSRVLGVETSVIRAWMRHGLIQPAKIVHRLCFFDFRQVAYAKTLSQLSRDGVSPHRLRKNLEGLEKWLPDSHDAMLGQLEAMERRGPLVLRTPDGRLAETSGQLRLDFEDDGHTPDYTAPIAPLAGASARRAEEWFQQGVNAEEEGRHEDALRAYERALRIRSTPEVLFNLGNTLYSLHRREEAAARYREATDEDPLYVEAWNNLGIVLSEMKRHEPAVRAFKKALGLEPGYADAHFNLAETWALLGEIDSARKHWRAYLAQDPNSPWAAKVREKLRTLEPGRPS